jgi:putative PIN family toxin of toxin-antitoxin system
MLRLVLDTNIVLDLLHFRDASVAPIMQALQDGKAACFTNAACSEELARVLLYPQFRLGADEIRRIRADYVALAQCCDTAPSGNPLPLCRDADDQKFLELARAAAADLLVSKDKALLALARKGRLGFRIVLPVQAAAALEASIR